MKQHCEIGRTSIRIRRVGLGAAPLSVAGRPAPEEAVKVIHAALEAGTNFIDTANVYCLDDTDIGHNEQLIARALRSWHAQAGVTVATKGGWTRPGGEWKIDARPAVLRRACEQSLRDLNVDAITLYYLHTPDEKVPFTDSVGELARLKKEGKILHVGLSNVSLEQLEAAQRIVRVEAVQNRCNPFSKGDLKNGLVDACRDQGVSYVAYAPLCGHGDHERAAAYNPFVQLSAHYGLSAYRIMLAWLLSKGDHIIPIPGARRIESAVDSSRALEVEMDPDHVAYIDTFPDVQ